MCKGKGYVPRANCKGCGRPAIKAWPPGQVPIIRYCGLEECFKDLVMIHKAGVSVSNGGYHPVSGVVLPDETDEFERIVNLM